MEPGGVRAGAVGLEHRSAKGRVGEAGIALSAAQAGTTRPLRELREACGLPGSKMAAAASGSQACPLVGGASERTAYPIPAESWNKGGRWRLLRGLDALLKGLERSPERSFGLCLGFHGTAYSFKMKMPKKKYK